MYRNGVELDEAETDRTAVEKEVKPPVAGHLVGRTVTGPIYSGYAVVAVAPPQVVFENLWELGRRAVDPEVKVVGSIAGRHAAGDAFFAHVAFTGFAAGSLFEQDIMAQHVFFDELTRFLLIKGDPTGLESLYLTAWQCVWSTLGAHQQRRAADLWNDLVRHGGVAKRFGIVGIDKTSATAVPFTPTELTLAGDLKPVKSSPWAGGYDPAGIQHGIAEKGRDPAWDTLVGGIRGLGNFVNVPGGASGSGLSGGRGGGGLPGGPGGFGQGIGQRGSSDLPVDSGGYGPGASQPGGLPGDSSGLGSGQPGGSGLPGAASGLGHGSGAGGLGGSSSGFGLGGDSKAGSGGMGNGMGSEGSSGLGQGGFGAPGAGGSSGGGQGGILGQDPNGPLGAIISDIGSRMDKLGDAQRAKAEAEKQSNTGTAKIATGAVFTGAGIAIAGKTGNYVGEAAAVLVVVIGLGLVVSGVFDKVQGEKDKAAADKVIADEQEKEREAAKKKMPPDLLRPSSYLLQVLALRTGDVFATGGGQASGATAAAAGVSPVVSKLLTGDGLAALFVTDDKGHVRLPVALPGAG